MPAFGGLTFLAINTAWLHAAHHLLTVPWTPEALFDNTVLETKVAILWTMIALELMLLARRTCRRCRG